MQLARWGILLLSCMESSAVLPKARLCKSPMSRFEMHIPCFGPTLVPNAALKTLGCFKGIRVIPSRGLQRF